MCLPRGGKGTYQDLMFPFVPGSSYRPRVIYTLNSFSCLPSVLPASLSPHPLPVSVEVAKEVRTECLLWSPKEP